MHESDSSYNSLFESPGMGNAEADVSTGRFVRVNNRFCEMLGYTAEELTSGRSFLDITHPDDLDLNRRSMEDLLQHRVGSVEIEKRYIKKDGNPVWVRITGTLLHEDDGTPSRFLGSAHDVTESRKAEGLLATAHRKLQSMMSSITDGLAFLDKTWRFTYFSEQGAQMLGICPEQLLGRIVWEVFPAARGTKFYDGFNEAVDTGKAVHFEEYYPEPLNRWIECHCYPSDDGLSVYFHDVSERKNAEQTLKETQALSDRQRRLYEAILGNTPDLAYVFDLNHRFIYANDVLLRMWGRTHEESIGKNCLELGYEPWHAAMHDREIEQVVATKSAIRGEVPFSGTFGTRIYDYIFVPVFNADGEVEAVAGTTRDVTERKGSEEQLREGRARLDFALNAAELGQWEMNLADGSASRTLRHAQIFGYSSARDDWNYERFLEHVVPEDRDRVDESFRQAVRCDTSWSIECRIHKVDGTERWIWTKAQIRRDSEGQVETMLGIVSDITDQKRAEEEILDLAATNAKFRTMFEQGTLFAGILSLEGTVIEVNHLALVACGYTRDEVIGRPFWECGWWNRSPGLMTLVREACEDAAQGRPFQGESIYFISDGSERYVALSIAPVTNENGEVIFIAPTGVDITDRKRLERKITLQAEELADQSRRKDEFLAMLGHELRNPLAPIRSALQLLKLEADGNESPTQLQAREIIERQTDNLTKLVSDLLEVSRVLSGRIRLELQTVDIKQIVQHALQTANTLIEQKKHRVSVDYCSESIWTEADATRLEEVLVNLINNAAKYTAEGGSIYVSCERIGDRAQIHVRDNGIGIEHELLPHIFDLFTQAERSLDRSEGGLGIGLSLARRLIEMHGGTVEVQSPPLGRSEGSEFTVTLPLVQAPIPMDPTPKPDEEDSPNGLRVLVVDDNFDLVTVLTYALKLKGYEVQIARNGPDGLARAREWHPDIVLLDIGLPGMNGFEVARMLRQESGHSMRLLALTGYGRETDIAMARESGFDGHLTKPFHLADLEKMMAIPVPTS